MSQLLMLDSIEVSQFSGLRFDALAGYVGGHWPDFAPEVADYPQLHAQHRIVSIAVNAWEDAETLDCEAGDATPSQCGPWVKRQLERGVWRPGVYGSESQWDEIAASIAAEGISRADHRRWAAKWVFFPMLTVGYDAQQWTDRYRGRNIDATQALDTFFAPTQQPPHHNGPNYDIFPTADNRSTGMIGGPFESPHWGRLDERQVVLHYDGARAHPQQYHDYIAKLESELAFLAHRVAYLSIHAHPLANGHPDWKSDHRGARFQALIHRAHDKRFV